MQLETLFSLQLFHFFCFLTFEAKKSIANLKYLQLVTLSSHQPLRLFSGFSCFFDWEINYKGSDAISTKNRPLLGGIPKQGPKSWKKVGKLGNFGFVCLTWFLSIFYSGHPVAPLPWPRNQWMVSISLCFPSFFFLQMLQKFETISKIWMAAIRAFGKNS